LVKQWGIVVYSRVKRVGKNLPAWNNIPKYNKPWKGEYN